MGRPNIVFDKDLVIDLYVNKNNSMVNTAKILGCGVDALRRFIREENIEKSKNNVVMPNGEILNKETLQKHIDNGECYSGIAEYYDCKPSTISMLFKNFGCVRISYKDKINSYKQRIYELYCEQNLTISEISKILKISPGTLSTYIKSWGFTKTSEQVNAIKANTSNSIRKSRKENYLNSIPSKEALESAYLESGKVLNVACKHFNVTPDTYKRWLLFRGVISSKSSTVLNSDEVQALLDSGEFIRDICKQLNCSEYILKKFCKEHNIVRSEEGKLLLSKHMSDSRRRINLEKSGAKYLNKDTLYEHIMEENLSYEQIAKIYGCASSTIGKWAKNYGIERSENQKVELIKDYVERGKQTTLERYGVFPYSLKDYNMESVEILRDKQKFEKYLMSIDSGIRSWSYIAKNLDIPVYLLHSYYNKYELTIPIRKVLSSYIEENVREWLEEWNIDYVRNDRTMITPKELDFYIPSKNIAIELNGNWSHSTTSYGKFTPVSPSYHLNKLKLCEDMNIRLIHLYEYEFQHTHRIKNYLKDLLDVNITRIYARKCEVKLLESVACKEFLNTYHIQGYKNASVNLGLFYNNELVSLMFFSKPRFNKTIEWELIRFVNKSGIRIVGGASKLFKYFLRNYSPNSIISYSNRDKFTGDIYKILGFDLDSYSPPNYVWVKDNIVYTRYQCQKHKLSKLLGDKFDSSLSESDNMRNNYFNKIYDCGNAVYIWRGDK